MASTNALIKAPTKSAAVTPSDTTSLLGIATFGVCIGGAGNLVFRLRGDTVDVTLAVVAGQFVHGDFAFIKAATTATGIVAFTSPRGAS